MNEKTVNYKCSVLNLSAHKLNNSEFSLLEKGLSFVPSPLFINKNCISSSAYSFKRRIKLRHMFRKKPYSKPLPFTGRSSYDPPNSLMPGNIKTFSWELDNLVKSFTPKPIPSNLSKSEKTAITSLKLNNNLIIKKADKGSTTVVLDRVHYVAEAEKQLSDPRFYKPLPDNFRLDTRKRVEEILFDLFQKGFIEKKQFDFLLGEEGSHRDRIAYFVPKIHKAVSSWSNPSMPPGRPIISDVGSQTYQIGKFISSHLKDIATAHDSYLKDTYDFLNRLKSNTFPPNAALFTLDVKSLYTNIDNKQGIEAVRRTMLRYPNPNRPDSHLLELLEICLTHNTFSFAEKNYIQTNGAAMGHSFCVEYANIKMADWEIVAITKCLLRPLFWVRFIDDIFGVWTYGREAFIEFVNILNCHDVSIQLTYDYQELSINFLDVVIYKGCRFEREGIYDTKVHFKDTDSHQLLHTSSFHPKTTFSSVVKSQVLRFHRICNNSFDFDIACNILFQALRPRGYSKRMLRCIKHDVRYANEPNILHCAGEAKPCLGPRCTRCPLINNCKFVNINGKSFTIKHKLDCNSEGVVYVITCLKCELSYVGETGNKLRTRLNQHINDVEHHRDTAVANHFGSPGHHIYSDFRITPIFSEKNARHRKSMESKLIDLFNTATLGMNEKTDVICDTVTPIVIPFSTDSGTFCHEAKKLVNKYNVLNSKVITAYNRHRNLKDILAPSKLAVN